MARLVIVSNRVAIPSHDGTQAGGLAVAVREVLKNNTGLWFGWSGGVAESPGDVKINTAEQDGITSAVMDLVHDDFQEYYNGFANRMLWPILHYRLDLVEFSRRDLSGYMRVNARFADELGKILQPDDVIWVHDYHLFPFAKTLRERGHCNKIGFFLHVPFPPPEILTALPNHQRLIPDLAHYDLVGFQTENDASNFARYLSKECMIPRRDRDTFQAGERVMRIGVFPIGIETAEFRDLARESAQADVVKHLVESLAGRDMIIGVDRLDYSKGLRLRMEGFESLLATKPEFRRRVSYLQITPKSRSDIPEYEEMERQISETVGRINGAFGEIAWTPIRYVNRSYSRTVLAGLYRCARAALVTPLRDGMNLVAKEYVAAQDEEDPGVLLLSRFAGAACELDSALIVNPYDPEGVGNTLARALTMPLAERQRRHEEMYQVLLANDVKYWGERFLTTLTRPHAVPTWLVRSGSFLSD